jgi:hypothetical protein
MYYDLGSATYQLDAPVRISRTGTLARVGLNCQRASGQWICVADGQKLCVAASLTELVVAASVKRITERATRLVDGRPTDGYRRIAALPKRGRVQGSTAAPSRTKREANEKTSRLRRHPRIVRHRQPTSDCSAEPAFSLPDTSPQRTSSKFGEIRSIY